MAVEFYRPTMNEDVLRSWAEDAQLELEYLRAENRTLRAAIAPFAAAADWDWSKTVYIYPHSPVLENSEGETVTRDDFMRARWAAELHLERQNEDEP